MFDFDLLTRINEYKWNIADVDVVYELKDGVLIKNKVEDYHERLKNMRTYIMKRFL